MLGPAAVEVLSRLAFFVASPALLFVTLAHADVGAVFFRGARRRRRQRLGRVPCSPCGFGLPGTRPPGEPRIGSMARGYVNAGDLGNPIATFALGNAAGEPPVMLFR